MNELEQKKLWKSILRTMNESPFIKEETIRKESDLAKADPQVRKLLEAIYLDENRELSFQRYCESEEFKINLAMVARHVNNNSDAKICEIGAGPGFLALALRMSGFKNVSVLEPNNEWTTGTGFITSTANKYGLRIWNDLDEWYESEELYDCIITKACVHHFQNVSKVAAEIRCKIRDDGIWLMFDEFFANSADELYAGLAGHAHVVKYSQYEWPYPASIYLDLMRTVGFKPSEIIPFRYKNNYLIRNVRGSKTKFQAIVTAITNMLIKFNLTILVFEIENVFFKTFKVNSKFRLFTFPQMMAFRLNKIIYPSVKL